MINKQLMQKLYVKIIPAWLCQAWVLSWAKYLIEFYGLRLDFHPDPIKQFWSPNQSLYRTVVFFKTIQKNTQSPLCYLWFLITYKSVFS